MGCCFLELGIWSLNMVDRVKWWILNRLPDKLYLQLLWHHNIGGWIHFNSPQSLNEKLQWLKLYDHHSLYTKLADKLKVKNMVANVIGDSYIVPTIGAYDSVDEIDFSVLPNRFAIKCTHDSGSVMIVEDRDRLDIEEIKKYYSERLKINYYLRGREWPYKNIKPRILIEENISSKEELFEDYKFYCYGGVPRYFMVSVGEAIHEGKNHKFDMNRKSVDKYFKSEVTLPQKEILFPDNFDRMVDIVRILCKGFQHVRIDLYNVNGSIYFGEFTFYQNGGIMNITDKCVSDKLSKLIKLKKLNENDTVFSF